MRAAVRAPQTKTTRSSEPVRSFVAAPPDVWLFGSIATLVAIGLVMIFSASSAQAYADHHDTAYYVKHQAIYLAVGLILAFAAYKVDYRKLKAFAPWALVLCGLALVAVLVPHVGVVVNGARRWIGAGAFSLQPSEFAKLGLVLYLAAALATRGENMRSFTKCVAPLFAVTFVLAMLVFVEPDMGTASLLVFTTFAMLFAAGARIEHLLAVVLVTLPPAAFMIVASPYKRARILAFLDPWKDPQNTGFHIVQSLLALGSGGLIGVGAGESRAKFFYLPEQYTDFIFSVLGEEFGLVGTVTVVVLFLFFAYRAIRIAIAAPDRFGFFLTVGCTAVVVIQAFVNIGVVTSSWPVTGVPLPFISFGGSSLIVSLICVALVMNVGRFRRVNLE